MTTRTLAMLGVALLTTSLATAQDSRRDRRQRDSFSNWTREGFTSLDRNRDGQVTRDEWHFSRDLFEARDRNCDGHLSRREFVARSERRGRSEQRGAAFRAGYERGQQEGRAAGREDYERHQGWDLEGQRELESADSGYVTSMGPRAEYQAGYREGFRLAYREGYGR